MTEYIFGKWVPSDYLKYVAMGVGVFQAINWGLNIPRDFLGRGDDPLVGRGADGPDTGARRELAE